MDIFHCKVWLPEGMNGINLGDISFLFWVLLVRISPWLDLGCDVHMEHVTTPVQHRCGEGPRFISHQCFISASSPIPLAMSCVRRCRGAWAVTTSPSGWVVVDDSATTLNSWSLHLYSFLFSTIPSIQFHSHFLMFCVEYWKSGRQT